MINVTSDKSRKLVIAQMSGFLDPADVDRFNADKEAAVTAMGLGSGEYVMLINTEGCVIQSQEVVAAFTRVVLDTRFKSKKLAVVRHDNLTRLQTRRILSVRDDAEIFASVAQAEAWLFDVGEQHRVA
ncbi:hypothetical protein [Sphingobium sp. Z007]|uniref:hypothetical protein n=1 Tax=Sphingobium sp. Z007 TaxID=627495 RepID=UPI000B49CCE5|nr:hypothetical protein [Sphingobium sp. Z007]